MRVSFIIWMVTSLAVNADPMSSAMKNFRLPLSSLNNGTPCFSGRWTVPPDTVDPAAQPVPPPPAAAAAVAAAAPLAAVVGVKAGDRDRSEELDPCKDRDGLWLTLRRLSVAGGRAPRRSISRRWSDTISTWCDPPPFGSQSYASIPSPCSDRPPRRVDPPGPPTRWSVRYPPSPGSYSGSIPETLKRSLHLRPESGYSRNNAFIFCTSRMSVLPRLVATSGSLGAVPLFSSEFEGYRSRNSSRMNWTSFSHSRVLFLISSSIFLSMSLSLICWRFSNVSASWVMGTSEPSTSPQLLLLLLPHDDALLDDGDDVISFLANAIPAESEPATVFVCTNCQEREHF